MYQSLLSISLNAHDTIKYNCDETNNLQQIDQLIRQQMRKGEGKHM